MTFSSGSLRSAHGCTALIGSLLQAVLRLSRRAIARLSWAQAQLWRAYGKELHSMTIRSVFLLTASLTLTGAAAAQEPSDERLQRALAHCEQMSSSQMRIACLEAALEAAYRAPVHAPSAPARRGAPALDAGPPADGDAFGEDSSRGGLFGLPRLFGGGGGADETSTAPAAEGLGSEQVAARSANRATARAQTQGQLHARVADAATIPYRRLEVRLDNGQVWRQIQGDTQRITPRGNWTVEIREARMGGYQMRINEIGRTIRVERIE